MNVHVDEVSSSYRTKIVRDLVWVFSSAPLVSDQPLGTLTFLDEMRAKNIVEKSKDWLRKLDENPEPLMRYVHEHIDGWALGKYFTVLFDYWFDRCPSLMNEGDEKETTLSKVQVCHAASRETLGRLKWVLRDPFDKSQ